MADTPRVPKETPWVETFEANLQITPDDYDALAKQRENAEQGLTKQLTLPVRLNQIRQTVWSRTWIIFLERLGNWTTITGGQEKKATFVLKAELTVEDDLTNHYIVRLPGTFYDAAINAKIAPVGAAARFTIEKSTDGGDTWATVLADDPGYLEIPDGDDGVVLFDSSYFSNDPAVKSVAKDNLLRINCTQIGSTTAGQDITVVVRWS